MCGEMLAKDQFSVIALNQLKGAFVCSKPDIPAGVFLTVLLLQH